jgi:protein SCO1/2
MKALAILALLAATAHAQPAPAALSQAGIDERIGSQVPLDTELTDTQLGPRHLRDVLDPTQPTILILAYARCTMLCSLVLRGAIDVARKLDRNARLVVISLDPRETVEEARAKRDSLVSQLPRAHVSYLVGTRERIDAITGAIGFRYAWDPRTEQYAHPAVLTVLSPDGRVARYLHGIQFDPTEVAAALDDAAAGRFLSSPAAAVLRCFHFEPSARMDRARIESYFRIGAASLAIGTLVGLVVLIRRKRRSP